MREGIAILISSKVVWRVFFCLGAAVFIVLGTWSLVNFGYVRGEGEPFATISHETTYATSPLDENGNINYAKYLDEKWREGVTPDENAVVLFAEILGPGRLFGVEREAECFERIGLEPLKNGAEYFLSQLDFSRSFKLDEESFDSLYYDEFSNAYFQPWSKEEYPRIADWLSANEPLEDKIRKAARRPKIYFPNWVPSFDKERHDWPAGFGELSHYSIDGLPKFTQISALRRIALGQLDEAIIDSTTVYHFGRLFNQLDGYSAKWNAALRFKYSLYLFRLIANSEGIRSDQLKQIETFVRGHSFVAKFAPSTEHGDRIRFLSLVQTAATDGGKLFAESFEYQYEDRPLIKRQVGVILAAMDWDAVLEKINTTFDRLTEVLEIQEIRKRRKEFENLKRQLMFDSDELFSNYEVSSVLAGPPKTKADWLFKILMYSGLDGCETVFEIHACATMANRQIDAKLSLFAIQLEMFRAKFGSYPKSLSLLVPKYASQTPKDPYGTGEYKYRIEGGDFLLYSVGRDGIDNGGSDESDDITVGPIADDRLGVDE